MIHHIQACISNEPYFKQIIPSRTQAQLVYEIHSTSPDDPPDEYICSCMGFRYNQHCAHQTMAWNDRCLWDERWDEEKQTPEQKSHHQCPRCGQGTYEEVIDD